MFNKSLNYCFLPISSVNENVSIQFSLYISISIGMISLIGTIFSLIGLLRFIREDDFRSHINSIYHYMLILCLSYSFVNIPVFYLGIYLSWFKISSIFSSIFLIHNYSVFGGLAYLLMWSSLEGHRTFFRLNVNSSFIRQMFPLILILLFVCTCSILFVLLPKCSKENLCEICLIENLFYVIFYLFSIFVLPIVIMFFSTIFLMWRLFQNRIKLTKRRRWFRIKRTFYQSFIYLGWFCLTSWPYAIYSFGIFSDPKKFDSIIFKKISYLISIYGIQILPLLTYFIFKSNQKRTRNKYVISNQIQINTNKQQKSFIQWLTNQRQSPIIERF